MSLQSRKAHTSLRNKTTFAWLAVSLLVLALDWLSKQWATESLSMVRPVEVFSWLNWILAHNTGAAFSILAGAGGWQRWFLAILAVGVTVFLITWLMRLRKDEWPTALALSLVIGGALGNVIDRLRLGYVVDFIDVHVAGWHWPAFNVADSAITCGVILLLIEAFREHLEQKNSKEETNS